MQLSTQIYNVLYSLIDLIGLLLDSAMIVYFANRRFLPRFAFLKKKTGLAAAVAGTALYIYFTGYNRIFQLFVLSIFMASALYIFIFYKGALYRKLTVCCIFTSVYFVLDSIYMPLFMAASSRWSAAGTVMELTLLVFRRILCKLIMFAILRLLLPETLEEEYPLPGSVIASMLVFCVFEAALVIMTIYSQTGSSNEALSRTLNSLFMAACLAMILSFYYLFTVMVRAWRENISSRLRVKEEDLHEQYIEQTEAMVKASRQFRHDMKAHIFCMQGLLEQKKYDELGAYMEQFSDADFLHLPFHAYCSNDGVNTILNQKEAAARQLGIPFSCEVRLSSQLNVETLDLCTLLSNLCDNAIEASRDMADPSIRVELQQVKGYLTLKVTNHTEHNVLRTNPALATTKADTEMHGLGMSIVREVVRKYEGSIDVTCVNHEFCTFIML